MWATIFKKKRFNYLVIVDNVYNGQLMRDFGLVLKNDGFYSSNLVFLGKYLIKTVLYGKFIEIVF